MDPLVENAYRQREIMERRGVAASVASQRKQQHVELLQEKGEGFFENGSSPYESGDFYESDVNTAKVVWNEI